MTPTAPPSGHGAADGIEWEDDMVEVNRLTTSANMHWQLRGPRPAAPTATTIDWRFTVGDRVKIRLVNEMELRPPHAPPLPPPRGRAVPGARP